MSLLSVPGDDDPRRAARRPLLVFLLVTLAVGAAASLFSEPALKGWYAGLAKPAYAVPAGLLPPVWTALYVLMAVAAWRVWRAGGRGAGMALYAAQLALTFAVSAVLFGAHEPGLALVAAAALAILRLAAAALFFRRDGAAGWLFLLPAGWALYEAVTIGAVWRLNP